MECRLLPNTKMCNTKHKPATSFIDAAPSMDPAGQRWPVAALVIRLNRGLKTRARSRTMSRQARTTLPKSGNIPNLAISVCTRQSARACGVLRRSKMTPRPRHVRTWLRRAGLLRVQPTSLSALQQLKSAVFLHPARRCCLYESRLSTTQARFLDCQLPPSPLSPNQLQILPTSGPSRF